MYTPSSPAFRISHCPPPPHSPTPTVQWTKQNGGSTTELSSNKSVLTISEVDMDAAGTYRCHPYNLAGEGGIHEFKIEVESEMLKYNILIVL